MESIQHTEGERTAVRTEQMGRHFPGKQEVGWVHRTLQAKRTVPEPKREEHVSGVGNRRQGDSTGWCQIMWPPCVLRHERGNLSKPR